MELAYYKDPNGNFGDDLNPWLWRKIIPDLGAIGPDSTLVGMGTLLDRWFVDTVDRGRRKFVLGAGGGMTLPLLRLDDSWKVLGVRGPLTARYLGLDPACALTDPASCIGEWVAPPAQRRGVGVMPHHSSLTKWDWQALCEQAGLVFLDPRRKPQETLARLNGLEKVIAEAMHGAIVADALRIPWVPLRINPWNYTGKWDDWASTLGLPVHFRVVPELYDPGRNRSAAARMNLWARAAVGRGTPRSSRRVIEFVKRELRSMAERDDGHLSEDRALGRVVDRFLTSAADLRATLRAA